ncbi:MAG: aminoglycoside phosphotransferase family protein [Cyanobacteria bacterium P01_G01_bin.39]
MTLFLAWKSCFYILLIHPHQPRVWIKLNSDNYSLAQIKIEPKVWPSDFSVIKPEIEKELKIDVDILHYTDLKIERLFKEIKAIHIVESSHLKPENPDGIWCDRHTLNQISFENLEHKSLINSYLVELETGNVSKLRPPWGQSGWYNQASNWIKQELDRIGAKQLAPVEYVKSWSISCVLRVETSIGNLYLKQASTLPLFCDEPVVTNELAKLFPNHIPQVISINREHSWLLLQDFGKPLGNQVSIQTKQKVYRLLAQIQIQSIKYCDGLLNIGCLDRRLNHLQLQIDPLMDYAATQCDLSTSQIEKLYKLAPYLKSLCSQLENYNIPQTLVHGDLHLHNVALNNGNYLLFDWTDACITHPFFDLFELFFPTRNHTWRASLQSLWRQPILRWLQNTYLSQWIEYESASRLLEAWNIARPLCALHHAVTYQHIMINLEPRSKNEFTHALPPFLREIIKSVSKLQKSPRI